VADAQVTNSPLADLWHEEYLNFECLAQGSYPAMFASGAPDKVQCQDGALDASNIECFRKCDSDDFYVAGTTTNPVLTATSFFLDHGATVTYTCNDGTTPGNFPVRYCKDSNVDPPLETSSGSNIPTC